jgi:hypothetical protein
MASSCVKACQETVCSCVWPAEVHTLSLLQGGTRLDPRAALDLQKLLLSIDQSEAQLVKQHQRHVEDCLASLLTAGAPPPVRLRGWAVSCATAG